MLFFLASAFYLISCNSNKPKQNFTAKPSQPLVPDDNTGDHDSNLNPQVPGDPLVPPQTVEEIKKKCLEAAAQNRIETKTFNIRFREFTIPQDACLGEGKATPNSDRFAAYNRDVQTVANGELADICDARFDFSGMNTQYQNADSLKFDDAIFITVRPKRAEAYTADELILAASRDYSEYFSKKSGSSVFYQWPDLLGKIWDNFSTNNEVGGPIDNEKNARIEKPYCFGSSDPAACKIPLHTDNFAIGSFQVNLPEAAQLQLGQFMAQGSSLEFALVVTGDDEPGSDCSVNKPIFFDIVLKYIRP